jgi:hypothetical protein
MRSRDVMRFAFFAKAGNEEGENGEAMKRMEI